MSYGLCEACGADVMWAMTLPGRKRMPIDPERYPLDDERANLVVGTDHLRSLFVRVITEDTEMLPNQWRGMPHFATCTGRGGHRAPPTDPDQLERFFPPLVVHDARR